MLALWVVLGGIAISASKTAAQETLQGQISGCNPGEACRCAEITQSGTYTVTNDLTATSGDCFLIWGRSAVTIEGNGRRITAAGGAALRLTQNASNIIFRNSVVSAQNLVYFDNGSNNYVGSDCTKTSVNGALIEGHTVENGGVGIDSSSTACEVTIQNNTFQRGSISLGTSPRSSPGRINLINNRVSDGNINLTNCSGSPSNNSQRGQVLNNYVNTTGMPLFQYLTRYDIRGNQFILERTYSGCGQDRVFETRKLVDSLFDGNTIKNFNTNTNPSCATKLTAIFFETGNTVISNNLVVERPALPGTGNLAPQGAFKLRSFSHDVQFRNNTVISFSAPALFVVPENTEDQPNITIDSNTLISTVGKSVDIGSGTNRVVKNNLIIGKPAMFINSWSGTCPPHGPVYMYNNTLVGEGGSALSLLSEAATDCAATRPILRGNIIYSPGYTPLTGRYSEDYNLLFPALSGMAAHSLSGDPLFVRATGNILNPGSPSAGDTLTVLRDYHLQSGSSPAVGHSDPATAGYGVTVDRDGHSRPAAGTYDMGAYEYGSAGQPDLTPPAAPQGLNVN